MNIKTIFLDMDGVIVDFHAGVLKLFGIEEVSNPNEWDFLYEEDFGVSAQTFWSRTDDKFWRELEYTKEALDIFHVLQSRDLMDRVCFLSQPVSNYYQGKVDWIRNNLCQMFYSKQFLLGPQKKWCAHPESLLIDDNQDHCRDFVAAGGHAFLFPRLWNINRAFESNAVVELEMYLDRLYIRGPKAWHKKG